MAIHSRSTGSTPSPDPSGPAIAGARAPVAGPRRRRRGRNGPLGGASRYVAWWAAGVLALVAAAMACDAGPTAPGTGQGTLRVLLTDAPFPFELVREANVTIARVDAVTDQGTVTVSEEERTFNLLLLRDGVTTVLGESTLPTGAVRQVRLVVTDASVVLDDEVGTTYELQVPSGAQTGIKILLPGEAQVMDGGETTLTLDFDLEESFVVQGDPDSPAGIQGFLFQPVVRPLSVSTPDSEEDEEADGEEQEEQQGGGAEGALGALRLLLTDAPFPFDLVAEANVAIARVDVVTDGGIVTVLESDAGEEEPTEGEDEPGDDESDDPAEEDDGEEDGEEEGDGDDGEGGGEDGDAGASVAEEPDGEEDGEEGDGESEEDGHEGTVFNLLELRDGITTLLGEVELPGEDLKQIRLLVTDAWVVMDDEAGTTHDLKVPSGAESGIKVLLPPGLAITPDATTILTLDFDVEKSFVVQGNPDTPAGIEGFLFKPTVHLAGSEVVPEESGDEEEAGEAEGGGEGEEEEESEEEASGTG